MGLPNVPTDHRMHPAKRFWRRFTLGWRRPAGLMLVGVAVIVIAINAPGGDQWYWGVLLFVGILAVATGALALTSWKEEHELRTNPDSRQRQVLELTEALKRAMGTVAVIRDEISEGNELLAELEKRAMVKEQLAEMSDPQVIAVTEQIRAEFRTESRRGLRRDVLLGAFFFALGVLVTVIFR
jgi:hypothetical protein